MRGQRHSPAALYPGERPGTHCTVGWVGPRAGLDRCGKSRPPPGFDLQTKGGVEVYIYSLYYFCARLRWADDATLQQLYPRERELAPIVQEDDWATGRSRWLRKCLSPLGLDRWTKGLVEIYIYSLFYFCARWRWADEATLRQLYPRERQPVPIVQEGG